MPLLCWLLLIADPCTARAEPDVKYASAPQLILLGLPKAGTTSTHTCLTSGAFHNPTPCCHQMKEPGYFRRKNPTSLAAVERKNGSYMRQPGRLLVDFSVMYVAEAARSIPKLFSVYSSVASRAGLRFVLLLRDPTARALSNFCMFQPTLRHNVARLLRNELEPREEAASGQWRASLSGLLAKANVTEEQLAAAFPAQLMGGDGGLNRTALAHVARDLAFDGRERLRKMLLPWTDVCSSDTGWGWNLDAKTFEQSVLDEMPRDPAAGCAEPLSAAVSMPTATLREYVQRCHPPPSFLATARLSVPLFQLALWLRELPDSHCALALRGDPDHSR
jgi:hypothetical protein